MEQAFVIRTKENQEMNNEQPNNPLHGIKLAEIVETLVEYYGFEELAKRINAPLSIVDKRREKPGEVAEMTVIGDVTDKICLIVDDMCDTAGTLTKAAEMMMDHGATSVRAVCTHPVLSGPAYERIQDSVLSELIVSDSIPLKDGKPKDKIRVIETHEMFSRVLKCLMNNESISSQFLIS